MKSKRSARKGSERRSVPIGRSENMRRIRSRDTKPELMLRRALFARGLRYRLNVSTLPGKPDIVFARKRLAIFVHGCFWHQHSGCIEASRPRTNVSYWLPKLARNAMRDVANAKALEALGYSVLIIWECHIERSVAAAVSAVIECIGRS